MSPRAIAMLGVFGMIVPIVLARILFFGGSRKRTPVPDPAAPRPARAMEPSTVCPCTAKPIAEGNIPRVPEYLVEPFVFSDRNLGIAMLAGWPIKASQLNETLAGYSAPRIEIWIFRVHGDHWCSVRKATPNDVEAVDNVKRYSRTLLIERRQ